MTTSVFILCIILGICFVLFFQVLSLLAYPMYVGIYALEGMVSGFNFKISPKGYRRKLMDGCAALCTLVAIERIWFFASEYAPQIDPRLQIEFHSLQIPLSSSVLFLLAIVGLFTLSHYNKKDEQEGKEPKDKDWIEKMDELKTPKRFRVFN